MATAASTAFPPCLQNLHSDLRRQRVHADHHARAARGRDRWMPQQAAAAQRCKAVQSNKIKILCGDRMPDWVNLDDDGDS